MSDLDAWLDDFKPYIVAVKVCGRPDLIVEMNRLEGELRAAMDRARADDVLTSSEVKAARDAVKGCEADIEASQREFTFASIGHRAWQDHKRKYPPSDAQRRQGMDCDLERFSHAVIADCSVDPKVTIEQSRKLADKLPEGEYEKLYAAVLQANGQVVGSPKSVLAAAIERWPQNGASSTSSLPEGSPDPSASDALDGL